MISENPWLFFIISWTPAQSICQIKIPETDLNKDTIKNTYTPPVN